MQTCVAPAVKCARNPSFTFAALPHSTIASMNRSDPPLANSASAKPRLSQQLR